MSVGGDINMSSGGITPPPGSAKKAPSPTHVQRRINHICSILLQNDIRDATGLNKEMSKVIEHACSDPEILGHYTDSQIFGIFKQALSHLNQVDDRVHIAISRVDEDKFLTALYAVKAKNLLTIQPQGFHANGDDLARVTQSYDRLKTSIDQVNETSSVLETELGTREFAVCKSLIIGGGDTATHLWLEKYKYQHGQTHKRLAKGELPDTLALAESTGNWLHDYTLAQPYNLLERAEVPSNPSDFATSQSYKKNLYVNARHLYQANIVNMATTDAPLILGSKVQKIEKKENHVSDWKSPESEYRVEIALPNGQNKVVYTSEIDVCAGLGMPRTIFPGEYMSKEEFEHLSTFDNERQFTPLVDGNQFMLTGIEEQSKEKRTIVVFGSGGTATACYRKAFFGKDTGHKPSGFTEESRKNNTLWIARDSIDVAGVGRLVKDAVTHARSSNEVLGATLSKIEYDPATKKLKLLVKVTPLTFQGEEIPNDLRYVKQVDEDLYVIECDQFVYSVGQDASRLETISQEVMADLELSTNPESNMPIGIKSSDDKIHFFGAAALSISARRWPYYPETRRWALESRIPPDAEWPGIMPPSRAQIKEHVISKKLYQVTHVNSNADSITLIGMLLKNAGVRDDDTIMSFINDLLIKRHETDSGITRKTLQTLLSKYNLDSALDVHGHGILSLKRKSPRQSI